MNLQAYLSPLHFLPVSPHPLFPTCDTHTPWNEHVWRGCFRCQWEGGDKDYWNKQSVDSIQMYESGQSLFFMMEEWLCHPTVVSVMDHHLNHQPTSASVCCDPERQQHLNPGPHNKLDPNRNVSLIELDRPRFISLSFRPYFRPYFRFALETPHIPYQWICHSADIFAVGEKFGINLSDIL